MKELNEFEVQTVTGGLSMIDFLGCAISSYKAKKSGKKEDVLAAALACETTGREAAQTLQDLSQTVYRAFSAPINNGQADLSPVGRVVIATYVEETAYGGGYWDNGTSCMAN